MDNFTIYIYLIILVKLGFISMAITGIYLKNKKKEKSASYKNVEYWKERFEFIFTALMAVLLIYLFNPRANLSDKLEREPKLLLYLFGFILLITAKWNVFFQESKLFQNIQKTVG